MLVTMFGAGEEELKALGASHVTWPYFANSVLVNGDMPLKFDGLFAIILQTLEGNNRQRLKMIL